MKTVTKTAYLLETSLGTRVIASLDLSDDDRGYILLAKNEVTFEIPEDADLVAAKVAAIDKRIEKVRDEFGSSMRYLRDQKAKLLCLENGVTA